MLPLRDVRLSPAAISVNIATAAGPQRIRWPREWDIGCERMGKHINPKFAERRNPHSRGFCGTLIRSARQNRRAERPDRPSRGLGGTLGRSANFGLGCLEQGARRWWSGSPKCRTGTGLWRRWKGCSRAPWADFRGPCTVTTAGGAYNGYFGAAFWRKCPPPSVRALLGEGLGARGRGA